MAVSTPGSSVPIGVYRGRGCGVSAIEGYETFIGGQVQKVLDFMIEKPASWAQFENGNLTSTVDVSVWKGELGSRQLVLGVPACCGASAGSGGTTWADEANGVNDAHWEALGNRLIDLGLGDALLRIGREFNGNWYQWQVTEGSQSSYIAGYQHIVTVLSRLPVPQDREQYSQDEDGGDDEQVVADHLVEADGGGDLGTAGRAEQQDRDDAGCRAEERQEELIGQAGDHPAVALGGQHGHREHDPAPRRRLRSQHRFPLRAAAPHDPGTPPGQSYSGAAAIKRRGDGVCLRTCLPRYPASLMCPVSHTRLSRTARA
jgi:hypothetical protein